MTTHTARRTRQHLHRPETGRAGRAAVEVLARRRRREARETMEKLSVEEWQKLVVKLAQPFETMDFLPRAPGNGQALGLPYIDARDVQTRLDVVCGGDWSFDFQVLSPDGKMVKGLLTVCGVTRCDAGEADQEGEPLKSAVSDALKRCAVHFGIGRYLYHLPKVWAPFDAQKRRFTEKPSFEARVISKAVALAIGQTLGHPTPYTPAPLADRQEAAANRAAEEQKAAPPAATPESRGDRKAAQQPVPAPTANSPANGPLSCAHPECGRPITRGQHEMSFRNFGAGYCPACQKLQARTAQPETPKGYLGGGNASAPPDAAPSSAPPERAPATGNDDPLTHARKSYMAAFHEKFGQLPDEERYRVETVLLGWEDTPIAKGAKAEWKPDNWWFLHDLVKRNRKEPILEAAAKLVNVHAGTLPLPNPVTPPAAPSGLSR
jgi:hypothetical protein